MQKFAAENPPFWANLGGKIELLSTHNLLCWKSAAVCQKIATFCPVPSTFLIDKAAVLQQLLLVIN